MTDTTHTRPTMIPTANDLRPADEMISRYTAYQHQQAAAGDLLTILNKSGYLVSFEFNGKPYTVTAGCECDALALTLHDAPRSYDHADERSVNLVCVLHGNWPAIAHLVVDRVKNKEIFGWVESRFEHDKRPQWGKSKKGWIE